MFDFENDEVRVVTKVVSVILTVIAVIILLWNSIYMVNEQQNAVVTMFGNPIRTDTSGLYFKIPFFQKVKKVDMTTRSGMIGYYIDENGQNVSDPNESMMITSDFNLLNVDFFIEIKTSDPVAYLYNSDKPEETLSNMLKASIRSIMSNYTVDEAMTTAKGQIQSEIKADILNELSKNNIGLTVLNVSIQDSEPPTAEVTAAFKAVETAKQGAETAKNNAQAYKNEKLPQAEAEADKIVQDANAQKEARIAEAEGQVARFNSMYEEYQKYPLITKKRMFYETMEDILPDLKVIVTDGGTQTMLPLESFSTVTETTATTEAATTEG